MPLFKVVLPQGGHTVLDGNNSMIVFAANADDAKNAAMVHSDADAAPWDQATATEITEDAALGGLIISVRIVADADNALGDDIALDYTIPEGASADTVDEVGALLTAALVAAGATGTTYDAGTDAVTFPTTLNVGMSEITATVSMSQAGGDYDVTGIAPAVSAPDGAVAATARTITLTALTSGTRPSVVTGYHTAQ